MSENSKVMSKIPNGKIVTCIRICWFRRFLVTNYVCLEHFEIWSALIDKHWVKLHRFGSFILFSKWMLLPVWYPAVLIVAVRITGFSLKSIQKAFISILFCIWAYFLMLTLKIARQLTQSPCDRTRYKYRKSEPHAYRDFYGQWI